MTKLQLIKAILELFKRYAEHTQAWNPEDEGDYDDLVDSVSELIYKNVRL
jgi:hypothetical protein